MRKTAMVILCLVVCGLGCDCWAARGSGGNSKKNNTSVQQSVSGTKTQTTVATSSVKKTTTNETKSKNIEPVNFDELLSDARKKCIGVAEELRHIKKMSTVNTVVTGVGTVAGGVAVYAGVTKAKLDRQVEQLEKQLEKLSDMSDVEFFTFLKRMAEYKENLEEYQSVCAEKQNLVQKSKDMGNLRTGMMVANTATAIAGTVIAGNNYDDGRSVAEHISDCKKATDALRIQEEQSRIDGDIDAYDRLHKIVTYCGKMYSSNLEKIYKNSNVAKISSAVNIGTGLVGTMTSAAANTDSVRKDNTESGKQKEKNLNTAANIFAGASTIASGVSTVFNAKTVQAINDNLEYAEKCEEVLK